MCIVRRWVHITMALLTLTDTLLTSRFSLRLGVPDKAFVLGASALGDALSQFRYGTCSHRDGANVPTVS